MDGEMAHDLGAKKKPKDGMDDEEATSPHPAKKPKTDEQDDDDDEERMAPEDEELYQGDSESSSEDSNTDNIKVDSLADVMHRELADDEEEHIQEGGTITTVKAAATSSNNNNDDDEAVAQRVLNNERWATVTKRGMIRLGIVIGNAFKNVGLPQDELDMSDTARDNGASNRTIECRNGDLVKIGSKLVVQPLSPEERVDYVCKICLSRAEFQRYVAAFDTQTDLYRGWTKYNRRQRLI